MHDPRLGRFFAIDPLSDHYPYNSPYSFSENRVLDCIELEGLEARKNVHYYNMMKQEDGSYKPVIHHSSSSLVIKTSNAKFMNSVSKKEWGLVKGEHGLQSQTTNVYTYWNSDGTVERQVVVSKDMSSQNSVQWQMDFDTWNKRQAEEGWNNATPEQKAQSEQIQAVLQPLRDQAIEMVKPVAALYEIQAALGGSGMASGGPISAAVQDVRAGTQVYKARNLSDVLEGATAIKVKPNAPEHYFSKVGSYQDALNEFNSLGLSNVKKIEGKFEGFTGTLDNGTTVTVRNGSSGKVSGRSESTLQFNPSSGSKTKIRYGN